MFCICKNTNGQITRGNSSSIRLMLLLWRLACVEPHYFPDTALNALWSICFFAFFLFTNECYKNCIFGQRDIAESNLRYSFYVFKLVLHRLLHEILLRHTVTYLIFIRWKGHDNAFCRKESMPMIFITPSQTILRVGFGIMRI